MNAEQRDFFRYKCRFLSILLILCYAYTHLELSGYYFRVSPDVMIYSSILLPFGQRLLLPNVAYLLHYIIPVSPGSIFFILECISVGLFFISLFSLMKIEFSRQQALLLTWLFLLLLPLMSVINYRFLVGGPTTIYYPWDSSSMFFMALGFFLILKERWLWFSIVLFLATLNRESSFLLALLIPAVYDVREKRYRHQFLLNVLIYALAHAIVILLTWHLPGTYCEWFFHGYTHVAVNMHWLLGDFRIFFLPLSLMFLPIFWFAFYDYIPLRFRAIRYVALFYFLGLFLVGNFMEARIFHETAVLLYLPVCLAVKNWLEKTPPAISEVRGIRYFLNRYAVIAVLILLVLVWPYLDSLITRMAH